MQDNKEVLEKLDVIIGLLAIQGKEIDDQIKVLRSLGFTISQISGITAIPEGTIKTKMRRDRLKND